MPFPLALALIVVVPELADVPVFRTVAVQVPLGVDVVDASACTTNGDPPSSTDMVISAAEEAVNADAGTRLQASNATHISRWRLRGLQTGTLKSIQHWDPSLPPRIARPPGLPSRLLLDAQGIREVVPLGFE